MWLRGSQVVFRIRGQGNKDPCSLLQFWWTKACVCSFYGDDRNGNACCLSLTPTSTSSLPSPICPRPAAGYHTRRGKGMCRPQPPWDPLWLAAETAPASVWAAASAARFPGEHVPVLGSNWQAASSFYSQTIDCRCQWPAWCLPLEPGKPEAHLEWSCFPIRSLGSVPSLVFPCVRADSLIA